MAAMAPVAVIIPTYQRGTRIFFTLEKIFACDPIPTEVWVHIDQSDGDLESDVSRRYPTVRILSSLTRIGPGGGRHRCLQQCSSPYAVSFDDDSYPVDSDFFERVVALFGAWPDAAILGASIWQRHGRAKARTSERVRRPSYTGCGYAIRVAAYRQTRGYLPRPVPYEMEESDLSIQLFASNWKIYETGELRVFHDTDLGHHQVAEITAGRIANIALFAYLHYPIFFLGWGLLQVANAVKYFLRVGRWRGVMCGLMSIPMDCYSHRKYRDPLPSKLVYQFIKRRRIED